MQGGFLAQDRTISQSRRYRNTKFADPHTAFRGNVLRIIAIFFATIMISGVPAHAQFTVCNKYDVDISVAYGKYLQGKWTSRGWFRINSHSCEVINRFQIDTRHYYIYAQAAEKYEGDTGAPEFNGLSTKTARFCVHVSERFEVRDHSSCSGDGQEKRTFYEVDTGQYTKYRLDLHPQ